MAIQVKWGDKDEGYGEQYWEYNHGEYAAPAYPAPAYPAPAYAPEYPSGPSYAAASKPTGDYVPAPAKNWARRSWLIYKRPKDVDCDTRFRFFNHNYLVIKI